MICTILHDGRVNGPPSRLEQNILNTLRHNVGVNAASGLIRQTYCLGMCRQKLSLRHPHAAKSLAGSDVEGVFFWEAVRVAEISPRRIRSTDRVVQHCRPAQRRMLQNLGDMRLGERTCAICIPRSQYELGSAFLHSRLVSFDFIQSPSDSPLGTQHQRYWLVVTNRQSGSSQSARRTHGRKPGRNEALPERIAPRVCTH